MLLSMMTEKDLPSLCSGGCSGISERRRGEESDEGSAADSPGPWRQERLKVTRDKLRTDYSLLASVAREEELVALAQQISV